jgi:predicted RNase H-like nuclease (RuvC/YqgF family)
MPEEIIPAPAIVDIDRPKKITCEFCECELGKSGEYKQLSEAAKRYRKLKDENEKLEGTLATVRQECEDLKRKLEAVAPKESKKKAFSF